MKMKDRLVAWLMVGGMMVGTVGAGAWLVWWVVGMVPSDAARVWALVATGLLPLAGWAGWWLGHLEARGRLDGIDQAIGKVMTAAGKTAELRSYTAREVKRPREAPVAALPEVVITSRAVREEVVEL